MDLQCKESRLNNSLLSNQQPQKTKAKGTLNWSIVSPSLNDNINVLRNIIVQSYGLFGSLIYLHLKWGSGIIVMSYVIQRVIHVNI